MSITVNEEKHAIYRIYELNYQGQLSNTLPFTMHYANGHVGVLSKLKKYWNVPFLWRDGIAQNSSNVLDSSSTPSHAKWISILWYRTLQHRYCNRYFNVGSIDIPYTGLSS